MNIMERVKELAEKKGITMYSLSQETGISQSTFSRLIAGKGEMSRKNLKTLADYFQVNLDWLVTGEGEKLPSVVQHNQAGDNINGHSVTVNKTETEKFLEVINSCHKMLREKDEQINRLLNIIENNKHNKQ